jgi:ubiquinone/menaquinone biosynthesis C-methylase UbiE
MKEDIVKYYNDLAKDYDIDRFSNSYGQYIHKQEDEILIKYLNENETAFNLDIACGTGRFLKYSDYGIDISKKMVEVSKNKYPLKKISIEDAEHLSFQDSFFDNVISFHLFMHLKVINMSKVLCEVNRVLKKGGYFIFDIPSEKRRKLTGYNSSNWHGANQISVSLLKKLTSSEWELISYYGTAFFPIHLIPKNFRKTIVRLDSLMSKSFLKEYSSHLIFILRKK